MSIDEYSKVLEKENQKNQTSRSIDINEILKATDLAFSVRQANLTYFKDLVSKKSDKLTDERLDTLIKLFEKLK